MRRRRVVIAAAGVGGIVAATWTARRMWPPALSDVRWSWHALDRRPAADAARVQAGPQATAPKALGAERGAQTTRSLLAAVARVTPQTPKDEFYELFRAVKERWQVAPQEIGEVYAELARRQGGQGPAERRQMSLLYGALAQTSAPAAVRVLNDLLRQATDHDSLLQGAAALGDQKLANADSLQVLWDAAQRSADPPARNAALLAVGSVAARVGEAAEPYTDQLLALGQRTDDSELREVVLAAMGNQGAAVYLPFIQQAAVSGSATQRATAFYSARAYASDEASAWLTAAAIKEADDQVKNEAIKALAWQLNKHDTLVQIAEVAAAASAADTQLAAAHVLLANRDRPSAAGAISRLAEATTHPEVKAALGAKR